MLPNRVYLFFFKQKTAYEMRISDWSADVCSSDLHYVDVSDADDSNEDFGVEQGWELQVKNLDLSWKVEVVSTLEDITKRTPGSFVESKERSEEPSCRERVCQYV